MGVVYRAHDPRLKRDVALKLLAPEYASDERFRERFLSETERAASLEHPNVVPIHDAGEVDGQLYLAMRFVDGGDLKKLLADARSRSSRRARRDLRADRRRARRRARPRARASRRQAVERRSSTSAEHVYLADFGLSRVRLGPRRPGSTPGSSLGTPAYVAPEQIEGKEVDGRADQYSLACLLYECLTGKPAVPARLRSCGPLRPPGGATTHAARARRRSCGEALAKDPGDALRQLLRARRRRPRGARGRRCAAARWPWSPGRLRWCS